MSSSSVRGHTHHIDALNCFLCELKDQGLLTIKHIPGDTNEADIFSKNMTSVIFNYYMLLNVGNYKHFKVSDQVLSSETV